MGHEAVERLRRGLVVSCQALPGEPLFGSELMARMAVAAYEGGAAGIRVNSREDIRAVREAVPLPVIGLVKRTYPDSPVTITPTLKEAEEAIEAGAHILALDATSRPRPGGISLAGLVREIRGRWRISLWADVSRLEEGVEAARLGFDVVATTLAGYTDRRAPVDPYAPDFTLLQRLVEAVTGRFGIPVVAEGRIWEPGQARRCLELGAFAVVVGSAITRPHLITHRFVAAMKGGEHA
ncbi:MAG: N-acetylmannosamine-6-phosphate 2-epimerase [Armatimonadota bacterium]|nr:N-acetylmannosamine-6-phosphate 2-epimerase [Armatimonadota bacterium]MDR7438645.1 N-acetylmannosamine-6-phosphate 2-epimerase [Armatimonadota bacterium]MDR7562634.1 N-acetylmannosamine-6-phosphate 2-epimerase [Armatimonadota bacterium]MDR7567212.1 N-acetylmannosamine-6-phosphate 2-epimerase [Armatimonadota bacterium]MDR7602777.1 N-acetylmannosamine-6-phosphate 2-epimerase [Armatimonadota bacterium]